MEKLPIINKINYNDTIMKYMPHYHNAYEMIYIQEGKANVHFGNRVYEAGSNTLIFISHLEEHAVDVLEEPYHRYSAIITPAHADKLISDSRLLSVFKNRPERFRHVLDVTDIKEELDSIFRALLKESQKEDEFTETYIGALLRELLICVYRNNGSQFPLIESNVKSMIYEIQKYIDRHYREQISISQIASDFYISPSYLAHSFRDLTGFSPKQYIMQNRLIYSKDLLTNTNLTVAEVGYQSGFLDINNYIKHFKKFFGETPRSIRKQSSINQGQDMEIS